MVKPEQNGKIRIIYNSNLVWVTKDSYYFLSLLCNFWMDCMRFILGGGERRKRKKKKKPSPSSWKLPKLISTSSWKWCVEAVCDSVHSFPQSGSAAFIEILYYLSRRFGELCMFPETATQVSFLKHGFWSSCGDEGWKGEISDIVLKGSSKGTALALQVSPLLSCCWICGGQSQHKTTLMQTSLPLKSIVLFRSPLPHSNREFTTVKDVETT